MWIFGKIQLSIRLSNGKEEQIQKIDFFKGKNRLPIDNSRLLRRVRETYEFWIMYEGSVTISLIFVIFLYYFYFFLIFNNFFKNF